MGLEWIGFGAVLAAGAVFVGFPFGVAVGYAWRDRISRARRAQYLAERNDGTQNQTARPAALARDDI
jgi:hypothetical protein